MTMNSHVTYSQPMSRIWGARFKVHDYTEGPSSMHPGDVNWVDLNGNLKEDAHAGVVFELGNLPPDSQFKYVVYAGSGGSRCAGAFGTQHDYNGERVIVDIWVNPKISGTYRGLKYLGYVICQHLESVSEGTFWKYATAWGYVTAGIAAVWAPVPAESPWETRYRYSPKVECWTGPHIHTYAARDDSLEQAGTYTTGIDEKYTSGTHQPLGVGDEVYRWNVDWDS